MAKHGIIIMTFNDFPKLALKFGCTYGCHIWQLCELAKNGSFIKMPKMATISVQIWQSLGYQFLPRVEFKHNHEYKHHAKCIKGDQ